MQKVFSDQTLFTVSHLKNLLEAANISVELRNEYAAGGIGELSFIDSWPELWVDFNDVALSKMIIKNYQESQSGEEWQCACGEMNGSSFFSCWSCFADKPN